MHTQNTTIPAGSRENRAFTGRHTPYARTAKSFTMAPDTIHKLALPLQGFLLLLMKRARRFGLGYTIDTDAELAELAGVHRSTVAWYLSQLRDEFASSAMVNGRRRIYPVDQWGNPTIPPELAGRARRPRTAPAHPQDGANRPRPL